MFSYIRLAERVPADHPLRAIRALTDEVLAALDGRFEAMYSAVGRPSIAPEMLLRATLLQAFFSVRSKRQLMEQIDYNLLFRWFVALPMDAAIWHPTVFSHKRERLMAADVAQEFLGALMGLALLKALLSCDHFAGAVLRFSVDGTLIDAWASMKSFQPKDARGRRKGRVGMASATFMAKSARTRPMSARQTPMRGFTRSRTASRAGCATWAM